MDYSYLKLLHVIAVIIFLGNIFTGLFWMRMAVQTRDLKIIGHTIKGVIRSDKLFTIPGVILITAFGFLAAIFGHMPILHTGWILWSIILFTISGIAFSIKVAPLQNKIMKLVSHHEPSNDLDWSKFRKLFAEWETWGLIALLSPVAALVMMILKIPQ